jgi:hypothetical protein
MCSEKLMCPNSAHVSFLGDVDEREALRGPRAPDPVR